MKMCNDELVSAFNVVVKYGYCVDCLSGFESDECKKRKCYQNHVKLIIDTLKTGCVFRWRYVDKDGPPKDNGDKMVLTENGKCEYSWFNCDANEWMTVDLSKTGMFVYVPKEENVVAWRETMTQDEIKRNKEINKTTPSKHYDDSGLQTVFE